MAHELPPLPYDYAALEPVIDSADHEAASRYASRRVCQESECSAGEASPAAIEERGRLIRDLNAIPEDIRGAVRNNGGGHVNHTMFWKIMKPQGGGDPSGPHG